MKRIHLVAGIVIILSFSFLLEYYTENRFPTEEFVVARSLSLDLNETQTFDYFWELEKVGTHYYVVKELSEELFSMISITEVSSNNKTLLLEGNFVFNKALNPEGYELFVDQDGEKTLITVEFSLVNVTSRVEVGGETIILSDTLPENTFLAENNMPGFWEILLTSADLEKGTKYKANIYVPQGGEVFELEFFVFNDFQTIQIDDQSFECQVISESNLELRFYISENELVQMRNDDQDTLLQKKLD